MLIVTGKSDNEISIKIVGQVKDAQVATPKEEVPNLQEWKDTVKGLEEMLSQSKKDNDALLSWIRIQKSHHKEALDTIRLLNSSTSFLRNEKYRLSKELAETNIQLQDKKRAIKGVAHNLDLMRKRYDHVSDERAKLKEENQRLRKGLIDNVEHYAYIRESLIESLMQDSTGDRATKRTAK